VGARLQGGAGRGRAALLGVDALEEVGEFGLIKAGGEVTLVVVADIKCGAEEVVLTDPEMG
jgi:hypothetical protein